MVLKSTPGANVPVYQVSGTNASRSLPDWLVRKRRQSLKKDPEYLNRIQLIQDFEFETASTRIKLTRDGNYAIATGIYKPQIHVYDFNQLTMKFSHFTDTENVDFVIVSDDWTKSVHLQGDRTLELHAQGIVHTKTRIPKFGRCITYNPANCDILVGASSSQLYRLNLDQGRFLAPFECESEGMNAVSVNPAHGLYGCGFDSGTVEFWDPRSRNQVCNLVASGENGAVTALTFHEDGLHFAMGTEEGISYIYDLRSSQPMVSRDQGYGFPIKNIGFLDTQATSRKIYTADKRIVKIWNVDDGSPYTSLEPNVDINDVAHIADSGMFLMANEGSQMHTYYVPSLGPAPRWSSFLDSITEELEEKPATSVYENFKFVTRKDLQNLNLNHLIGSNVVKSYMHGYFIDLRLYEEARLISDPFAYRDHREKEIRKKIEKERESRIRSSGATQKTDAKVNKEFASYNKDQVDDRFKALFEDPEYEIDKNSVEYKLLHGGKPGSNRAPNGREAPRALTAAEQENLSASESSSESEPDVKVTKSRPKKQKPHVRENEIDMIALDRMGREDLTLGEQLKSKTQAEIDPDNVRQGRRGEAEITYIPKSKRAKKPERQNGGREAPRDKTERRRASKSVLHGR